MIVVAAADLEPGCPAIIDAAHPSACRCGRGVNICDWHGAFDTVEVDTAGRPLDHDPGRWWECRACGTVVGDEVYTCPDCGARVWRSTDPPPNPHEAIAEALAALAVPLADWLDKTLAGLREWWQGVKRRGQD